MKKLNKDVEIGEYKFTISINRDIAIKCCEKFTDFFSKFFNSEQLEGNNIQDYIKNKKLRYILELNDYIKENSGEVVEFALPLMLEEANCNIDSDELIKYIKDKDADDIFNAKVLEFIIMGFTPEEVKKPKVKIKI